MHVSLQLNDVDILYHFELLYRVKGPVMNTMGLFINI